MINKTNGQRLVDLFDRRHEGQGGGGGGKGQKRVKKTSVVYNITLMMIGENATSEKK